MKTLLQITQEVLSEINGDDVNSITETEEAEQVAKHIIAVYDNIVSKESWNLHRTGIQLNSSGDSNKPTHMTLPTNVKEFISLHYDTRKVGETKKAFVPMKYKEADDFLRYLNSRDSTATTVTEVVDDSGVVLLVRNNIAPTYFTSFDDEVLIFDAHDSAVDTTLQTSKTQGLAYVLPTLSLADSSVPDLPLDAERYLIEQAISRCQWKMREFQDVVSESEANKQRRTMSRKAWRANKPSRYPDYGRKV